MSALKIRMVSETGSDEYNQQGANEVAWQHATSLAAISGIALGSDEFVKMYQILDDAYQNCGRHHGYLHHIAGRLLSALLESGNLHLATEDDTAEAAQRSIGRSVEILLSGIMWAYASDSLSWVSNEEWNQLDEDVRSVYFVLGAHGEDCDCNEGESHDHD